MSIRNHQCHPEAKRVLFAEKPLLALPDPAAASLPFPRHTCLILVGVLPRFAPTLETIERCEQRQRIGSPRTLSKAREKCAASRGLLDRGFNGKKFII
jgi:hypothetical protein